MEAQRETNQCKYVDVCDVPVCMYVELQVLLAKQSENIIRTCYLFYHATTTKHVCARDDLINRVVVVVQAQ